MARGEGGQHAWRWVSCMGIVYSLVGKEVSREVDGVGAETVWGEGDRQEKRLAGGGYYTFARRPA